MRFPTRIAAVAAGGVALVLAATSCSSGGGEPADPTEAGPQELVVSIWADYYPEDLAEQFEAATGIKLTIVNHTTNEDVVAKLTASADPGSAGAFMSGQYAQALA
jgi:spermidine/putrescine transport system substrate-binding protein